MKNPGRLQQRARQAPTPHAAKYRALRASFRQRYYEDGDHLNLVLSRLNKRLLRARIGARLLGYAPAAQQILYKEMRRLVKRYPDLTKEQLQAKIKESGRGRAPIIEGQDGLPVWINRKMRKGRGMS